MNLWFKQCYVTPILSGAKRETMRRTASRLPDVGDEVGFQVGPRPVFAQATITALEPVDWLKLSAAARAGLLDCGYEEGVPLTRLLFHVKPGSRRWP